MKRRYPTHIASLLGVMALLISPLGFATSGSAAEGTDNARFVFQSVPNTMTAGQTYYVQITMQNTGTSTWTAGAGYKLGSQNPQDNTTWGLNRVALNRGRAVSPGNSATFRFNVTAPPVSGIYNFQWQMVRDTHDLGAVFFGDPSINVPVNVVGGTGGANDAQFVSQNVPTAMVTGNVYNVSVRMRNNGTTTWGSGTGYALVSQNPPNNTTWGLHRVAVPGTVSPGQEVVFDFAVAAPASVGVYDFQWQMFQDGQDFFGDVTPNVAVNVTSGVGTNDATFVAQNVPASALAGEAFGASITMHNNGSTTWTNGTGYRLGSQNPQDNTTWGLTRVTLPADVPPGGDVTITFNATAPTITGTYNFQWQMVQEGVGFFGQLTTNVPITVTTPGTGDTGFGNNLSTPVIFAEGYGITGAPTSVDAGIRPTSEEAPPSVPFFDPNYTFVVDGVTYYPQKTPSTWQAQWANGDLFGGEHAVVNWSDNLLNTKWTSKSVVRIENVLYTTAGAGMTGYTMLHLSGSGTNESWGTDGSTYPSTYKTIYSATARLKIEKLNGPNGDVVPNPCGFDGAVYEKYGTDGPGGYGAEVNVSGNVVYGFNWQLNQCSATNAQKLGWYRLTFTLDTVARYWLDGSYYYVPCNVSMDALDPVDLQGRFFIPRLVSSSTSVLEIEIVGNRQGGGGGGGN